MTTPAPPLPTRDIKQLIGDIRQLAEDLDRFKSLALDAPGRLTFANVSRDLEAAACTLDMLRYDMSRPMQHYEE
jgi:hypothetical protein